MSQGSAHDAENDRGDKDQSPCVEKSLQFCLICGKGIEYSWIGNGGHKLKDRHKKSSQACFKGSQSRLCEEFARCSDEQTTARCTEYGYG